MTQSQTITCHPFVLLSTLTHTLTYLYVCVFFGCGGSKGASQQAQTTTSPHEILKTLGSAQPIMRYASSSVEARVGCEQREGEQGEVKLRDLASRLGSDLRVHEYCRAQKAGTYEEETEGRTGKMSQTADQDKTAK